MKQFTRRLEALEAKVPPAPIPVPGIEVQFVSPGGRVVSTLHLDPEDKHEEVTR